MEIIHVLVSLIALIILEIILGVDNLVFLSIMTEKLPHAQRRSARRWGLSFAWITRLILLASAVWLVKATHPLIVFSGLSLSARDLFLMIGGLFLIYKATQEIHLEVADHNEQKSVDLKYITFKAVVIQVAIMDIVFSLDSVLTAIGLTTNFWIMSIAITIAIVIMIYASEPVSGFIDKNPTIKMLALCFLILIGVMLIADGFSFHIPRAYIYFAMGFSLGVEGLNHIRRTRSQVSKGKNN